MPLVEYTKNVIKRVKQEISGKVGSYLHIRCYRTDKLKEGCCIKNMSPGAGCPMIVLGYANDVGDFTITMIHELLHIFRWDEKILDTKAEEIYKQMLEGEEDG